MPRSTDHFLTTHTGSLPRPDDLIRTMYAKEEGVPVEPAALAARVRDAVAEIVKKQTIAGIDVVNDGEMSKPSYATYVKDRLTGFGGAGNTFVYQDLSDYPNLAKRVFGDPGRSRRKTPACNAAIGVRDAQAAKFDVDNLKAGLKAVGHSEAFMSAASPGVIALFFRNEHYSTHDKYLYAIADAMGRHIQFADLSVADFKKRAAQNIEVLNHSLAAIRPERLRLHLCWGNYEGPHHHDVALSEIIDLVFNA